jgi:hypothetical protein
MVHCNRDCQIPSGVLSPARGRPARSRKRRTERAGCGWRWRYIRYNFNFRCSHARAEIRAGAVAAFLLPRPVRALRFISGSALAPRLHRHPTAAPGPARQSPTPHDPTRTAARRRAGPQTGPRGHSALTAHTTLTSEERVSGPACRRAPCVPGAESQRPSAERSPGSVSGRLTPRLRTASPRTHWSQAGTTRMHMPGALR